METDTLTSCLMSIANSTTQSLQFVRSLETLLRSEDWKAEKGISLLEVKNHQLLDYLINLTLLMIEKLDKRSISGSETIERLVELRTVLERQRPIEHKMQYQIDKLLKTAVSDDSADKDDSLKHRPRPQDLEADESGSSGESSDEEGKSKDRKSRKYVPPKLMAVPYGGEEREMGEEGGSEGKKSLHLRKSLIQELQQQYGTGPEEFQDATEHTRHKVIEEGRKRTEYEEENMLRLQLTKIQRSDERRNKSFSAMDSLMGLDSFDPSTRNTPKNSRTKGKGFKGSKSNSSGKKRKRT